MKNLIHICEKYGFNVTHEEDCVILQQHTPEGEDWNLYFDKIEDIIEYSENYDPEEDFAMWIEARQRDKSVPGPAELWEDQLWKQHILKEIVDCYNDDKSPSKKKINPFSEKAIEKKIKEFVAEKYGKQELENPSWNIKELTKHIAKGEVK